MSAGLISSSNPPLGLVKRIEILLSSGAALTESGKSKEVRKQACDLARELFIDF